MQHRGECARSCLLELSYNSTTMLNYIVLYCRVIRQTDRQACRKTDRQTGRCHLTLSGRTHGIGAFVGVFCTAAALLAEASMAARARVLAALGVTNGADFGRAPVLDVATALQVDGRCKC